MPFRISFKGVTVFLLIVVLANLVMYYPFTALGLSPKLSTFLSSSIFGTAAILLVIGKIDGKFTTRSQWIKWTIISAFICILLSYYLTFISLK